MTHLDHPTAIALAEGSAPPGATEHVDRCRRCRDLVAAYTRVVAALATSSAAAPPPDHLTRWARAVARTRHHASVTWRVLAFLTEGATAQAAVRLSMTV